MILRLASKATLRRYHLSAEQYLAILELQGGVCAICGGRRPYALHIDHDHLTGRVRGLLCKRCNHRLLPASLDGQLLAGAAAYLAHPPAFSVVESTHADP